MCLILFGYQSHADYPIVLLSNRDEFYERPTLPAHYWPQTPQLLAGLDQRAGGTWLGINRNGRLAAVTNFREPVSPPPNPRSRGELTRDYLLGEHRPGDYLQHIAEHREQYAGFNLLVGDRHELHYFSNRSAAPASLAAGIYGLSNGLLDSHWPKVTEGKQQLQSLLDSPTLDIEAMLQLLADRSTPADHDLPDTGVGIDAERTLGSRFIHSPGYGTRTSTVLLIDQQGRARWIEQHYNHRGQAGQRIEHSMDTEQA